ncbi:MAG: response regulator [Thalassobaculaceae bacterium]|nr:response regulator [Thalassobaculaceae bacterium]
MAGVDYSKLTILVIEDVDVTRRIIMRELRAIGVGRVEEATNGHDGLMKVGMCRPDLVFCDIHMGPIDGFEFLEKLRMLSIARLRETPVVFLTADAEERTVFAARKLDVDGYMVKPFSNTALRTRIDASLAARDD